MDVVASTQAIACHDQQLGECYEPKPPTLKTCTQCCQPKSEAAFARKGLRRDSRCKLCKNVKRRELYQRQIRKCRPAPLLTIDVRVHEVKGSTAAIESVLLDIARDMLRESA